MERIRTIGCFVQAGNKFIILHRLPTKSQGNKWGVVAGLQQAHETDEETLLRVVKTETGRVFSKFEFLGQWNWHFDDLIVEFPTYRIETEEFAVELDPEQHDSYRWVTAEEFFAMQDIVHGCHELLGRVGYIKNVEFKESCPAEGSPEIFTE